MKLIVQSNVANADAIYQQLVGLHQGRSEEDSMRVNARLLLLLINHIGDPEAIGEAMRRASGLSSVEKL